MQLGCLYAARGISIIGWSTTSGRCMTMRGAIFVCKFRVTHSIPVNADHVCWERQKEISRQRERARERERERERERARERERERECPKGTMELIPSRCCNLSVSGGQTRGLGLQGGLWQIASRVEVRGHGMEDHAS